MTKPFDAGVNAISSLDDAARIFINREGQPVEVMTGAFLKTLFPSAAEHGTLVSQVNGLSSGVVFVGVYTSITALETAVPSPLPGAEARIDPVGSNDVYTVVYDADSDSWEPGSTSGSGPGFSQTLTGLAGENQFTIPLTGGLHRILGQFTVGNTQKIGCIFDAHNTAADYEGRFEGWRNGSSGAANSSASILFGDLGVLAANPVMLELYVSAANDGSAFTNLRGWFSGVNTTSKHMRMHGGAIRTVAEVNSNLVIQTDLFGGLFSGTVERYDP